MGVTLIEGNFSEGNFSTGIKGQMFGYDSTGEYKESTKDLGIHLWFKNGSTNNGYYHLNVSPTSYDDQYTAQTDTSITVGANKKIGSFINTSRTVSVSFKLTKLLGTYDKNDKSKIIDDGDNSIAFMDDYADLCNPVYNQSTNRYITGVPEVWLQVNKNKPVYGIAEMSRSYDLTAPIINGEYSTVSYTIKVYELRSLGG